MATELNLDWQRFPTIANLSNSRGQINASVDGSNLLLKITINDAEIRSLRSSLKAPDANFDHNSSINIFIDSSGNAQFAKVFAVNLAGGIMDGVYESISGISSGADYRWDVSSKMSDSNWQAEMKIPLSELDLNPTNKPKIYAEYRRISSTVEVFATANPDAVSGCLLCVGMEIKELNNLNFAANKLQNTLSVYAINGSDSNDKKYHQEKISLTSQWQANEDWTFKATVNPNFAEREPDNPVLRYEKQFSQSQSENRQFFAKNSNFWQTIGYDLINTRSLADPSGAISADYKSGNWQVSSLYSKDKGGGIVLLPNSYSNGAFKTTKSDNYLARALYGERNYNFAGTVTYRDFADASNSLVTSVDGLYRLQDNLAVSGLLAQSTVKTCATVNKDDCAKENGNATYFRLRQAKQNETSRIEYFDVSPNFRADMGWVSQSGYRKVFLRRWDKWDKPISSIAALEFYPSLTLAKDYQGNLIEQTLSLPVEITKNEIWLGTDLVPQAKLRLNQGGDIINARHIYLQAVLFPNEIVNKVALTLDAGELPDYANSLAGKGISAYSEIEFNLIKGLSGKVLSQFYQTKANDTPSNIDHSYREIYHQFLLNWQYAGFSRLRYVSYWNKANIYSVSDLISYQSKGIGHSLLWENSPRIGWGWSAGVTTLKKDNLKSSNEFLVKLSHSF